MPQPQTALSLEEKYMLVDQLEEIAAAVDLFAHPNSREAHERIRKTGRRVLFQPSDAGAIRAAIDEIKSHGGRWESSWAGFNPDEI